MSIIISKYAESAEQRVSEKKRNEQESGENQQQLDIDSEDKEGDQESCGTLDPTKNALVEKIAHAQKRLEVSA